MDQRRLLSEGKVKDRLLAPERLLWHGATISLGDVMLLTECAIIVVSLQAERMGFRVRGQRMNLRCKLTDFATVWDPENVVVEMLLCTELISKWPQRWSQEQDGSVLVLHAR